MADQELSPVTAIDDAGWLRGRFDPPVADIAATGFEAYVRVCHPAERDGRRYLWADVAKETGRTAHALMQWHAIVGATDYLNKQDSQWPGQNPRVGQLESNALAPICEVLARHTSATHCSMGVWEGYGFIDPGTGFTTSRSSSANRPRAFSRNRPTLTLWGRSYYIFQEALLTAVEMADRWNQSPNVIWPTDRAWFLGTEIDFDSTLIGGSDALAQDLLTAPDIDAWPVGPDASFTASADMINAPRR